MYFSSHFDLSRKGYIWFYWSSCFWIKRCPVVGCICSGQSNFRPLMWAHGWLEQNQNLFQRVSLLMARSNECHRNKYVFPIRLWDSKQLFLVFWSVLWRHEIAFDPCSLSPVYRLFYCNGQFVVHCQDWLLSVSSPDAVSGKPRCLCEIKHHNDTPESGLTIQPRHQGHYCINSLESLSVLRNARFITAI